MAKLFKLSGKIRRSAKSWLPSSTFIKFSGRPKGNRTVRHAKQYHLALTAKHELVITLKRFKTRPKIRPVAFRRLVIQGPSWEMAIRHQRVKQRAKQHAKLSRVRLYLNRHALVPLIVIFISLAGLGYFVYQSTRAPHVEAVKSFSVPAPLPIPAAKAPKGLSHSEPTQLSIPSIGVDSPIMSVGRNADGSMETPPLFVNTTGWYKYSPTPGEVGPSVIVGHIDTYKGPAVFWRLRELKAGDLINVTRTDGKTVTFKVEALKQFEQDAFPTQEVYGNIDHAGLRLITCGGTFNRQTGFYSQNTVIFASIVT